MSSQEAAFATGIPPYIYAFHCYTWNSTSLSRILVIQYRREGHVTLEFSNTTTLPAKIYANEGVAQMLFFESDEVCETSYADRGGKYQGQRGVTLPRA